MKVKNRIRDFIIDVRLLEGFMRAGLYYFYCQPLLREDKLVECRPKWYRRNCLRCLLKASKEIWDYKYAGEWEDR